MNGIVEPYHLPNPLQGTKSKKCDSGSGKTYIKFTKDISNNVYMPYLWMKLSLLDSFWSLFNFAKVNET